MNILILGLVLLSGLLVVQSYVLLALLSKAGNRITETNKQLLIVVAGKEAKPEALRALVASNKPPQGKLKGIANEKDGEKKPSNIDYTLTVGEKRVL